MSTRKIAHQLEVTTPGYREIVMTRAFDAPRDLVFDAFTKPDLIRRWLLGPDGWSMPVCEVDLRQGGSFSYRWRSDADGREFGISGVYREVLRPERVLHVERMEGAPGEAVVTTRFVQGDGATTVTMTIEHESGELRDMMIETGMADGVARSYERLEELLKEAAA